MAQGEFTKEEATATEEALVELFKAIPKSRQMGYIGHLNDISLFIAAAKRKAPAETKPVDIEPAPAGRQPK